MRHDSLDSFLGSGTTALTKGPVALIFAEDPVQVDTTVFHHLDLGFKQVLLFAPKELNLPDIPDPRVQNINYATRAKNMLSQAINRIIAAAPGLWLYYCYNTEYLFFPFCETRSITDMLTFHTEERRDAMLTYVIDIYAGDLSQAPDAVSIEDAHLDKSGYYALARPNSSGQPKDRQLDFFGGLRWRFEEHIPTRRRRIDRIAIFKAQKGLKLSEDHLFNIEEYNTYACPWHHNLTAAIVSFRTAKALKSNAGSTFDIASFHWHNSTPFTWNSQQLLDLGLMEPGQWF
nr:hypothetical protein [uncultured Celeribacter sp.]